MIDINDIYKFVDKICPKLFLDGWEIEIRQVSEQPPEDVCAELKSKNQYREATLTIYPHFFKQAKEKQQKILIHELCHIITSIQNGVLSCSRNGAYVSDPEMTYAFEEETTWMANIINKLLTTKS